MKYKYYLRKIYVIIKRTIDKFDWLIKRNVDHDWFLYDRHNGE